MTRLRALLSRLRPEGDIEATFISGLVMIATGFLVAQLLGSILYAPLSLIVPGSVLTVVSLRARPEPVEESE
jgi:hypothetical protein